MARKDPFAKAHILAGKYMSRNKSFNLTAAQGRRWRKRVNKAIGW